MTFGYGPAGATPVVGDWDGNGADSAGVYIPATSTFLGITGYEQIAAIGFDANLAIAEVATSNGVSLTLGSF